MNTGYILTKTFWRGKLARQKKIGINLESYDFNVILYCFLFYVYKEKYLEDYTSNY